MSRHIQVELTERLCSLLEANWSDPQGSGLFCFLPGSFVDAAIKAVGISYESCSSVSVGRRSTTPLSSTDATSGNFPAFLGRLATYNIDLGALTIPEPNTFNYFLLSNGTGSTAGSTPGLVFNQPLTVASGVNLGIQVAYLADSGQGLVATDNLESLLSFGAPPQVGSWTAGSPGTNGFYQNGAKATNGATGTSLLGSDFNVYTNTNLGLAMRLYSQPAPEPCTCLLGFGCTI